MCFVVCLFCCCWNAIFQTAYDCCCLSEHDNDDDDDDNDDDEKCFQFFKVAHALRQRKKN